MISVLIPFHLNENQRFLDLCLQSIEKQNIEKEVIVISGADTEPIVPEWVKLDHNSEKTSYAKKINRGALLSNPGSKYILIAQDDLIFGRDAIKGLVEMAQDFAVILNPLSNCDNHYWYESIMEVTNDEGQTKTLERFMKYHDIIGFQDAIMNLKPNVKMMFPVKHNFLYCSLVPRNVWNLVGPLDEEYINGCEDTDYCMRAKQKHINTTVTTNAFVFHFGGATTSKVELTHADKNCERFISKWGWDPRYP